MKDLTKLEQKRLRHLKQERKERLRFEQEEDGAEELSVEAEDVSLRESMMRQIHKNVAQLVIVGSFAEPALALDTLDRLLILAELEELEILLCLNKIDALKNRGEAEKIARLYRGLNYSVLLASAATGEGFADLRHKLEQKHSVFVGACGAGKTSLLRALDPAYEQKQTTRNLQLMNNDGETFACTIYDYKLAHATEVLEVNGIDLHEHLHLPKEEVRRYYAEFRAPSLECAVEDCLHIHEKDCGVMQAAADGAIARARYASYQKIFAAMR